MIEDMVVHPINPVARHLVDQIDLRAYPSERPVRRSVPFLSCRGSTVVSGEGDNCVLKHAILFQGGYDTPHGLV